MTPSTVRLQLESNYWSSTYYYYILYSLLQIYTYVCNNIWFSCGVNIYLLFVLAASVNCYVTANMVTYPLIVEYLPKLSSGGVFMREHSSRGEAGVNCSANDSPCLSLTLLGRKRFRTKEG